MIEFAFLFQLALNAKLTVFENIVARQLEAAYKLAYLKGWNQYKDKMRADITQNCKEYQHLLQICSLYVQ